MIQFLGVRLLAGLATLVGVSILVFSATQLLPGDVVEAVLGRDATPERAAIVRERLNLDRSATRQYIEWVDGIAHADFGTSVAASATVVLASENPRADAGVPVTALISDRLRNTLVLLAITAALLVPLSLLLGTLSALNHGKPVDRVISVTTLTAISLPEFVVAAVLILMFALAIPLFPAVSFLDPSRSVLGKAEILVLPVATLLAGMLAHTTRMVRAGVLDVLESEYILMAGLRGLPRRVMWTRYIVRNAIGSAAQVIALNIAYVFGGIIVVEAVFQYPGIGLALLEAISTRDIPVIQAIALLIAAAYVTLNLIADFLTVLLTPRLRTD